MMYIITIDSSFIRDAQYADTNGLLDSEMESIYMDSNLDYLWKDFYPEHFITCFTNYCCIFVNIYNYYNSDLTFFKNSTKLATEPNRTIQY